MLKPKDKMYLKKKKGKKKKRSCQLRHFLTCQKCVCVPAALCSATLEDPSLCRHSLHVPCCRCPSHSCDLETSTSWGWEGWGKYQNAPSQSGLLACHTRFLVLFDICGHFNKMLFWAHQVAFPIFSLCPNIAWNAAWCRSLVFLVVLPTSFLLPFLSSVFLCCFLSFAYAPTPTSFPSPIFKMHGHLSFLSMFWSAG